MHTLLVDIKSNFNNQMVYGYAGDKIKFISSSDGRIAIVEDLKGERFTCLVKDMTADENIVIEKKDIQVPNDKPFTKPGNKKTSKVNSLLQNNQPKLF